MPWDNSTRSARLPRGWHTRIRPRILRRDDHTCTHPGCHHRDPTGHTLQVDHIIPGDDHSDHNLQTLCEDHHKQKTIAERRQPRNRPAEPHPGIL